MRIRIGMAIAAVGVVAATAFAVTLPAQADEVNAQAVTCIKSLEVVETEDNGWQGDEPYMRASGKTFWNGPNGMDDGAKAAINKSITVGTVLAVWEADSPDGDDFIESVAVVNGTGTWDVQGDGAHYLVKYSRGSC